MRGQKAGAILIPKAKGIDGGSTRGNVEFKSSPKVSVVSGGAGGDAHADGVLRVGVKTE